MPGPTSYRNVREVLIHSGSGIILNGSGSRQWLNVDNVDKVDFDKVDSEII